MLKMLSYGAKMGFLNRFSSDDSVAKRYVTTLLVAKSRKYFHKEQIPS